MEYPTLEDYLLIAEAVLGVNAADLVRVTKISLAESALAAPQAHYLGVEHYPDPSTKAGVLCFRVSNNHALPDGNKRVALLLMLDFLERNGLVWRPPTGGQSEVAEMIERAAGKEPRLEEREFVAWVTQH